MVSGPVKIVTSEGRELLSIGAPSVNRMGVCGLFLVESADVADLIPDGRAAGAALAVGAFGFLLKGCVRRSR